MHIYRNIPVIILLLAIYGCSATKTTVAMMRSTDHFTINSKDLNSSIYHENSDSTLADEVKKHLLHAIQIVEREHHKKFVRPVKIYATSNLDSFESLCGYRFVLGCVVNEKLFLSPRLISQPTGTLPRLLTHELSHLHIAQQLSLLQQGRIPTWFREGLAVHTSTKIEGSAKIELEQAISMIKKGKTFYPNDTGSILFPKDHTRFKLTRSHFYRQAASFVDFLAQDQPQFEKLLLSVQCGNSFSTSFQKSFGVPVKAKWTLFIQHINLR